MSETAQKPKCHKSKHLEYSIKYKVTKNKYKIKICTSQEKCIKKNIKNIHCNNIIKKISPVIFAVTDNDSDELTIVILISDYIKYSKIVCKSFFTFFKKYHEKLNRLFSRDGIEKCFRSRN